MKDYKANFLIQHSISSALLLVKDPDYQQSVASYLNGQRYCLFDWLDQPVKASSEALFGSFPSSLASQIEQVSEFDL